jgi:hypothetical protein
MFNDDPVTAMPNVRENGPAPSRGTDLARLPIITPVSSIVSQPIRWVWPYRIPADTLVLIEGPPEVGKTSVATDIVAHVTSGAPWPDENGVYREPATVLIVGSEDHANQVVRPRLEAAGADLDRVFLVSGPATADEPDGTALSLPRDLALVRYAVTTRSPKLVYLDALNDLLSGVNINHDQAVRAALRPLVKLAESCGVTFLATRHFGKGGNAHAANAGLGSVGFTAVARVSLQVYRDLEFGGDPEMTPRLLAVAKNNLALPAPTLAFQLVTTGDNKPAKVKWVGVDRRTADELQASYRDEGYGKRTLATAQAADWLRESLAGGPQRAGAVKESAEAEGISVRTLQRAAKKLGVIFTKSFAGSATWSLSSSNDGTNDGTKRDDRADDD